MLPARVVPVPENATLLDTDEVCTDEALDAAWEYGARGIIRYVGFGVKASPEDISLAERDLILRRGFGLMLVQHVRYAFWTPTEAWGQSDGQAAVRHALAAGYLEGSTLWDDLEGIAMSARQGTIDYANAKYGVVQTTFEPGEYIGDSVPLTGDELYHWLSSCLYWKSASQVPDVSVRGYVMVQSQQVTLGGVTFDVNRHAPDLLGGSASWTIGMDAPTPSDAA